MIRMMNAAATNRVANILAWCLVAGVAGCAFPSSPQSHTDRATLAACRAYASQVYDMGNRGTIYSINQSGTPYSASYAPTYRTNELAAQYSNDKVVDDCVRNTGTETDRSDTAPAGAPAPVVGPAPAAVRQP